MQTKQLINLFIFFFSSFFPQKKYENLVSGTMPVESHLYKQMLIYLNAEIALNTVIDKVDDVLKWLRSTFLYVRAMANPKKYGIDTHPNCIEIVERELQGK